MPSDDYASFGGGGALKLKGGKVSKGKKKRKDKPSDLERALSAGESSKTKELADDERHEKDADRPKDEEEVGQEPVTEYKTDAERRHEEYKRKKVRIHH